MTVTVLLVDDHPLVIDALQQAIRNESEFTVYTAASLREGRDLLAELEPDVLVCDVRLPDGNGLKLIEEVVAMGRETACLVLSSFDTSQYVAVARRLGAAGYVLKTEAIEAIIGAIRKAAAGGTAFGLLDTDQQSDFTLTKRDRELVAGVVLGQTNDEIAGRLAISRKGVEAHLSRLFDRAGVSSRTELAVRAALEGWLDDL